MEELENVLMIMLQIVGMGVLLVFVLVLLAVIAFLVAGVCRYFSNKNEEEETDGIDP